MEISDSISNQCSCPDSSPSSNNDDCDQDTPLSSPSTPNTSPKDFHVVQHLQTTCGQPCKNQASSKGLVQSDTTPCLDDLRDLDGVTHTAPKHRPSSTPRNAPLMNMRSSSDSIPTWRNQGWNSRGQTGPHGISRDDGETLTRRRVLTSAHRRWRSSDRLNPKNANRKLEQRTLDNESVIISPDVLPMTEHRPRIYSEPPDPFSLDVGGPNVCMEVDVDVFDSNVESGRPDLHSIIKSEDVFQVNDPSNSNNDLEGHPFILQERSELDHLHIQNEPCAHISGEIQEKLNAKNENESHCSCDIEKEKISFNERNNGDLTRKTKDIKSVRIKSKSSKKHDRVEKTNCDYSGMPPLAPPMAAKSAWGTDGSGDGQTAVGRRNSSDLDAERGPSRSVRHWANIEHRAASRNSSMGISEKGDKPHPLAKSKSSWRVHAARARESVASLLNLTKEKDNSCVSPSGHLKVTSKFLPHHKSSPSLDISSLHRDRRDTSDTNAATASSPHGNFGKQTSFPNLYVNDAHSANETEIKDDNKSLSNCTNTDANQHTDPDDGLRVETVNSSITETISTIPADHRTSDDTTMHSELPNTSHIPRISDALPGMDSQFLSFSSGEHAQSGISCVDSVFSHDLSSDAIDFSSLNSKNTSSEFIEKDASSDLFDNRSIKDPDNGASATSISLCAMANESHAVSNHHNENDDRLIHHYEKENRSDDEDSTNPSAGLLQTLRSAQEYLKGLKSHSSITSTRKVSQPPLENDVEALSNQDDETDLQNTFHSSPSDCGGDLRVSENLVPGINDSGEIRNSSICVKENMNYGAQRKMSNKMKMDNEGNVETSRIESGEMPRFDMRRADNIEISVHDSSEDQDVVMSVSQINNDSLLEDTEDNLGASHEMSDNAYYREPSISQSKNYNSNENSGLQSDAQQIVDLEKKIPTLDVTNSHKIVEIAFNSEGISQLSEIENTDSVDISFEKTREDDILTSVDNLSSLEEHPYKLRSERRDSVSSVCSSQSVREGRKGKSSGGGRRERSRRVEHMLNHQLFQKHLAKHADTIERRVFGIGRKGLRKSLSNFDLSADQSQALGDAMSSIFNDETRPFRNEGNTAGDKDDVDTADVKERKTQRSCQSRSNRVSRCISMHEKSNDAITNNDSSLDEDDTSDSMHKENDKPRNKVLRRAASSFLLRNSANKSLDEEDDQTAMSKRRASLSTPNRVYKSQMDYKRQRVHIPSFSEYKHNKIVKNNTDFASSNERRGDDISVGEIYVIDESDGDDETKPNSKDCNHVSEDIIVPSEPTERQEESVEENDTNEISEAYKTNLESREIDNTKIDSDPLIITDDSRHIDIETNKIELSKKRHLRASKLSKSPIFAHPAIVITTEHCTQIKSPTWSAETRHSKREKNKGRQQHSKNAKSVDSKILKTNLISASDETQDSMYSQTLLDGETQEYKVDGNHTGQSKHGRMAENEHNACQGKQFQRMSSFPMSSNSKKPQRPTSLINLPMRDNNDEPHQNVDESNIHSDWSNLKLSNEMSGSLGFSLRQTTMMSEDHTLMFTNSEDKDISSKNKDDTDIQNRNVIDLPSNANREVSQSNKESSGEQENVPRLELDASNVQTSTQEDFSPMTSDPISNTASVNGLELADASANVFDEDEPLDDVIGAHVTLQRWSPTSSASDSDQSYKTSVLRSTSDVSPTLSSERERRRRDRKERPYKSDPFTSTIARPTSLLSPETPVSSSLSASTSCSFHSLDELDEQSDNNSQYEDDDLDRRKRLNRLSNASTASEDSGVSGSDWKGPGGCPHCAAYMSRDAASPSSPIGLGFTSLAAIPTASLCSKCLVRRRERKETIQEMAETEKRYGRDLAILKDEFYRHMKMTSLLTLDQLDAIFMNLDELLTVHRHFMGKLTSALVNSVKEGDESLSNVEIGGIFVESSKMFLAFEHYCVNQAHSSALIEQLEKEKELLKVFLQAAQNENPKLRRMHLKTFLMVPVQRVMKYPLLLSRLYSATPSYHGDKANIRQARDNIEDILEHINSKTKTSRPKRLIQGQGYSLSEKIEVNRVSLDVLGWHKREVCDIITSRLWYGMVPDSSWASRRARNVKFTMVHVALLSHGRPTESPVSPRDSPQVLQVAMVLVKEKGGKYTVTREPLLMDRCVVTVDPDYDHVFEVHEQGKDTFLFKAETRRETSTWVGHLKQLSRHLGYWRRRRNGLPNVLLRTS